jgi:hypothetical protein
VLVDAMYPRVVKATRDFPWAVRLAGRMLFSRTVWREIDKMDETGEAVLALPGIDDKPIVRLVNEPKPHPGEVPPIALDLGVFNNDRATYEMVQKLYPKARTVVVDSDHQIPLATPEAVVGAIHGRALSGQQRAAFNPVTMSLFNFNGAFENLIRLRP